MTGEILNKKKFCVICQRQYYTLLHKFPKDNELRNKWVENTGIQPQGTYLNSRICNIHFNDFAWRRQLTNGKINKVLKDDAVPTLLLKDNAPPIDAEHVIPHLNNKVSVRCAVCCKKCLFTDAVPIYDKLDYYTAYGVALAIILKITSRALKSRYSCPTCSKKVLTCYQAIVEINISTMLASKSWHKCIEDEGDGDETSEDEDHVALNKIAGKIKCSKKMESELKGGFEQYCTKCEESLTDMDKFTEHFLTHLYTENREVFRRNIMTTQVDELELEMAVNDTEMELIMKENEEPDKKVVEKPKKEKKKEKEEPIEDVVDIKDKIEVESDISGVEGEESHIKESMLEEEEGNFSAESDDDDDYMPDDDEDRDLSGDEPIMEEISAKENKTEKKRGRRPKSYDGEKPQKRPWKEPNIPGPRVCYLCGMKLKSHRTYVTHMERHKNPEKFNKTCHLCGKRRVNIAQHIRLCKKDKARENKERNYPSRKLPCVSCRVCGKKVCEMYLKRHLKGHEIDDDIARNGSAALDKYLQTCGLCGRRVKHLGSHMIQHQKKGDIPKTEILSNFDCDHCGATFNQRTLLVNHMVLKHGADPKRRLVRGVRTKWTCSVCKQEFLSYNLIRKHTLAEHNGVGCDLQCEVCGKKYNARTSYIFHINSQHLDYFKHRCKQCGQYFVEEESYKEHCLFRCPSITGGRRKRSSANKEGNPARPKPKRELTEPMRPEERSQEHLPPPNYNNIYSSYEAVYNMNHLGNRYLQF